LQKTQTHLEPNTKHTRHSPRRGGPRGPPERPSKALPRAKSASLEGSRRPRAGSASLEGSHPPRAGSASLEAPSRAHLRHYAPGNHALALFRQLPRGSPSPPLWGTVRRGRCQLRDTVPPTPVRLTRRALEGGSSAPSNPLLVTPLGQTMTSGRRERHPRRCQSCAAILTPAAPRRALLQLLRRC
jgi:hypothetical protein